MTTLDLTGPLQRLRAQVPLVQCITNTVVQQFSANVLLAAGASPAMLDHEADAAQFARIANGILVNLGTATSHQLLAADAATTAVSGMRTPWVLDPVSYGGVDFRSQHIARLARSGPACIRGNASEIAALAGQGAGGRGIESTDEVDAVLDAAGVLARRSGSVVAVSGPIDAIVAVDPDDAQHVRIARVGGGSPLMPLVVGTGCSLGALTAAYLGASPDDPFAAVAAAHAHFAAAGEDAGRDSAGPGSFAVAFVDALHAVTADRIAAVDMTVQTGAGGAR
ncbi:MAG TPA: hydroxyethylthiazole kinase [Brevibacterium senegalense]|uniref:Hydroxyethylthiazole kinase n=1 Tax=Brevibacterium senegalense TaxID=1033736 RepID=A0A921SP09_9MICO|nr:hydroxyethylthiazole kinase [Brevibacterium senegalense]